MAEKHQVKIKPEFSMTAELEMEIFRKERENNQIKMESDYTKRGLDPRFYFLFRIILCSWFPMFFSRW